MKKYVWLVIALLLVVSTGRAADYVDSLRSMAVAVKINFGVDSTSNGPVSTGALYSLIRQGMVDVAMRTRGIEAVSVIRTKRDTSVYALDTACLGVVSVEWFSKDSTRVVKYEPRVTWPNDDRVIVQAENNWLKRPIRYDYTNDSLYVHPTPWIVNDSLRVTYWKKPVSIMSLTALTQMEPQYRHAVLAYVLWRIALSKTDARAEMYFKDYAGLIAELRGANAVPAVAGN